MVDALSQERFDLKPEYLAADTAYGSAEMLNWVVNEQKIAPHIPVIDKSQRADGTFSVRDFRFDTEWNVYVCPAGKTLHTTGTVHDGTIAKCPSSKCFETASWLNAVEASSPSTARAD